MKQAGVELIDIDRPQRRHPRAEHEKSSPEKFLLGALAILGLTVGALLMVIGATVDPSMVGAGGVAFGLGWSALLAWLVVGALRSR